MNEEIKETKLRLQPSPFMMLSFLSEVQKSILYYIRTSGREDPMRHRNVLVQWASKFKTEGLAPGKGPLYSLCHSHSRQGLGS